MIHEQIKFYIDEINELKMSNKILSKNLEENNKEINSLKIELEEKNNNNISSNEISMIKT